MKDFPLGPPLSGDASNVDGTCAITLSSKVPRSVQRQTIVAQCPCCAEEKNINQTLTSPAVTLAIWAEKVASCEFIKLN